MSLEFTSRTEFAPLNTQIDADRDYRDHVLSGFQGCGCGCGGADPCPQGMGDFTDSKLFLYGVPILLVLLWPWPLFSRDD